MSLAFLYAGQGSQHPGMGADLYEAHPAFRAVLDAAGVDFDLKTTMFTDPDGVLNLTEYTQPCMVAFAAGMTAVLGLDREKLQEACRQAAVDQAAALAKELGAKRCLPLKVSGPFHTSLLAPAGDALREKFKETTFGAMRIPVLFNCLGREMGPEDTIPALLEKQVQTSVYMEDTIRRLAELGVDTIVEIGPGKALSGFVKKTAPAIKTYAVETCADLDALSAALKG